MSGRIPADQLIRDYLLSDATLMTMLSGGVVLSRNLNRLGIDRSTHPELYGTDKKLKPVLAITSRSFVGQQSVTLRAPNSIQFGRSVLEFYFYVDGDSSDEVIFAARDYVYSILNNYRAPGIVKVTYLQDVDNAGTAVELGRARLIRADYQVQESRRQYY